jgi:hypothetical protein
MQGSIFIASRRLHRKIKSRHSVEYRLYPLKVKKPVHSVLDTESSHPISRLLEANLCFKQ